jgi:PTH2 family peptidyl-tRNA hydrolase
MEYKQVIVIRKDLNMRKGKMCAQAAHASIAAILGHYRSNGDEYMLVLSNKTRIWLDGPFTKVVVGVDSEEDLRKLYNAARSFGMHCSLIKDSGKTEFKGVPTYTAVAIGPDTEMKVDAITGHLKLL